MKVARLFGMLSVFFMCASSVMAFSWDNLYLKVRNEDRVEADRNDPSSMFSSVAVRPKIGVRMFDTAVLRLWPQLIVFGGHRKAGDHAGVENSHWVLRYDDFKFLNQKDHGIDLRLVLRLQDRVSDEMEKKYKDGSQGSFRFYVFKSFGDQFRIENKNKSSFRRVRRAYVTSGANPDKSVYDISARGFFRATDTWEFYLEPFYNYSVKFDGGHNSSLKLNPAGRFYVNKDMNFELKALRTVTSSASKKTFATNNLGVEGAYNWRFAKGSDIRFKMKTEDMLSSATHRFDSETAKKNFSAKLLVNFEVM